MSQATRALVERLKLETTHLPGNVPLHNKALETITEILDSMVEPVEEVEEESVSEPESAEEAPAPEAAAEDPAEGSAGEESAEDDGSGPMTTGNAPT